MKEFVYPNAIVRVHFPDITEEEHERRMRQVHKAAEGVLKSREKGEKNGKKI